MYLGQIYVKIYVKTFIVGKCGTKSVECNIVDLSLGEKLLR